MTFKSKIAETKLRVQFRLQIMKLPKEVLHIFTDELLREIARREKKGDKK